MILRWFFLFPVSLFLLHLLLVLTHVFPFLILPVVFLYRLLLLLLPLILWRPVGRGWGLGWLWGTKGRSGRGCGP